ncbi:Apoptotic chromatin condensation inducer in the nucleus [Coemansia sp. RSA 2424]|nr:Apoptotic chromatin condensation inducer in the nucleus [Coemansia sp. RSA 2424]
MSELIPSELKVADLRKELAARDLPTNGLKKDLVQRLEEALAAAGTPVQPSGGEDEDQIDLLPADESAELEVDHPEAEAAMVEDEDLLNGADKSMGMMDADDALEPERKRKAEEQVVSETANTHMETEDVAAVRPPSGLEDSLYIKHLERPLTVYRLKEMLAKYGVVDDVWLNSIKTRGYASYATKEQAVAAHAAINGTRFPADHGKVVECGFITRTRMKELVAEEEAMSESVRNVDLMAVPVEGDNCGVALLNPRSASTAASKRQKTDRPVELRIKGDRASTLAAETSASLITAAAAAAASEAKDTSVRGRRGEAGGRSEKDASTRVTRSRPPITYRPLTDDEVAAKRASSGSTAAGA